MAHYKVSIVNYLNSAPFVRGLQSAEDLDIEIFLDHPSESARRLVDGEVDIALAPVAIIPRLKNPSIVSKFCIGCDGPVKTVKLFSDVPVGDIKRIYLDYQSRTSVLMTKILCRKLWNIEPELVKAYPGFQKDIVGDHAGLIIGDRAIRVLGKYKCEIDLGEAWRELTGLPFVFAVWLADKQIDHQWAEKFNVALAAGLDRRNEVIEKYVHLDTDLFSVREYLTSSIDYQFDEGKKEALEKYMVWAAEIK